MTTEIRLMIHKTCRSCGSTSLTEVLSLGEQYVSDFLLKLPELGDPFPEKVPIVLDLCGGCTLVQQRYTAPQDFLYSRHYWYRSGVTGTMREALKDVVRCAVDRIGGLRAGDVVLDIGSNDGTLLRHYDSYSPEGVVRVGVEPADNLATAENYADRGLELIHDFWPSSSGGTVLPCDKARIITACGMFYDLEDPNAFLRDVARVLAPDGLFVAQLQCLRQTVELGDVGNFCLPASADVVTSDGLRSIFRVKVGDAVLTHKGRYRRVRQTFSRWYDGEMVELKAYGFGHTLLVTPEHPVMVLHGAEWRFIEAADVRVGDVVGRPIPNDDGEARGVTEIETWVGRGPARSKKRCIPVDDLLDLFGYYLSEGSIASNGDVIFYFGKHESGLIGKCRSAIKNLGFGCRVGETRTCLYVRTYGPISRLLQEHCGRGASGKILSPTLLNLSREQSQRLIRSYCDGDGYVYRRDYLRASTVSRQLAFSMAMLANRAGWKVSINQQDRPATCQIEGRVVSQLPLWDVLIHTAPKMRQKTWMEGDYQCGRVKSVGRVHYEGEVCNLDVDEDHTYVSPAMTVHNCHEHLEFYSLQSLILLLGRCGLGVVDVEENSVNGGSYRVYCRHLVDGLEFSDRVTEALAREETVLRLADPATYRALYRRMVNNRDLCVDFLFKERDRGRRTWVYGASTKGNVILQWYGLDGSVIEAAADRSPEKWGRYTVGTGIPIASEECFRQSAPDYALVLPYTFRDEFLEREREREWRSRGGKFVFPLPEFEVV